MVRFHCEPLTFPLVRELTLMTKDYQHLAGSGAFEKSAVDIDWASYNQLHGLGALLVYTVRLEDSDKLVGFAFFILQRATKHQGELLATCDAIFIEDQYRGHGYSFIAHCDNSLRACGVTISMYAVTPKRDYSPVLKRLGHQPQETFYSRRL